MSAKLVTKKDYFLVSIIGSLSGLFALPALKNIRIVILPVNFITSTAIVVCSALLSVAALRISVLINRRIPILQITKFAAAGSLNTLLNFGILNVLMIISGINMGIGYTTFVGLAFLISNINSYFWNKYWTFHSGEKANIKEYGEFIAVSLVGLLLAIVVASITVNWINRPPGVSPERWANVGNAFATLFQLIWNFIAYKFIVFKGKGPFETRRKALRHYNEI